MLQFDVHKKEQGFTLIETLVIVIIIGILSGIAAPSFLAINNRKKVEDAASKVQVALQEAQREAIRKSKTCTINVPDGNNQALTSDPASCFVTGQRQLDGVSITSNLESPKQITFSFRGNSAVNNLPSGADSGIIVLSMPDSSDKKRCLAIGNGIGIMRAGIYNGSTSSITSSNCITSQ